MGKNHDLLRQIQEDAISTSTPVSELLRRCQVLAARVGISEMGEWVRHELSGYPAGAELPGYRILYGTALGMLQGAFGSGMRNAPLPAHGLPPEWRDYATRSFFRDPIAALEAAAATKQPIGVPWPADLIALVQHNFYENMVLRQATLHLNKLDVIGAIDTVRNRILSFALEAESIVGDDGRQDERTRENLTTVFHNHIYGDVGNLAQGSSQFSQHATFQPGDLDGLLKQLGELGVEPRDLDDLKEAVSKDGPSRNGKPGERVAGWAGKMMGKALSGALKIGVEILPKLIERYYSGPQ